MTPTKYLVDSSFLYSLLDKKDPRHRIATQFASVRAAQLIIPYVVMTEVGYLCRERTGIHAVMAFMLAMVNFRGEFEGVTRDDLLRSREIIGIYASARFDFVDCCLMAMTERMNITRVCTFDRRDFSMFVPKHVPHLDLLP